ncbi:Pentatricopeptide repeat-containing protein At5g40400 [Linum perenne]
MNRISIKLFRKAAPFASDGPLALAQKSSFSSSSSSSLQLIPEEPNPKPQSNPLYSFLTETRNPNNIVNLISSSLKQQQVDISLLRDEIKDLLPHLGSIEISRVLLRCQSDSVSALAFFNWVKNDLGHIPTTRNYCLILHILAWSKEFKPAMKLLTELIQSVKDSSSGEDVFQSLVLHSEDCNWDPVVFDMLIKAYVKVGGVKEGFITYFKVIEFGYVPTVSSCNCLLNGLLKLNFTAECWQIYEEMVRLGIRPNSFTFNILTHAFCKDGDVSKVNEFLEKMEEEGFEPDIVTYNTLISSYCRKGRLADAYYLYKIMYRRGVLPDLVSYTALISGLCKEGKMKEALQFFHRMVHRGFNPDVIAYNTLICGYCKEGRIQEAKSLLYQMIANGICPDSFTCRVLIQAYVKDGRLISALNLAVELERLDASIPWDVYDYLIVRLCEEDKPFAAKSLLERKCQNGYEPDMLTYEKLIESLSKVNSLADALLLKSEIIHRNRKPSLVTYKALIAGLCRTGRSAEAEMLMDEMVESGIVPGQEICWVLISGYCKERAVGKAESLLESFAKEFNMLDNESYNEVARIVCEDGDAGKLMDLQERMLKVGYAPSSMTFKYTIQALSRTVGLNKEKETYNTSVR